MDQNSYEVFLKMKTFFDEQQRQKSQGGNASDRQMDVTQLENKMEDLDEAGTRKKQAKTTMVKDMIIEDVEDF